MNIDGDAFVVADVHGNLDALAGLLHQEGILDDGWERINRDVTVVQVGDLCNCVASSVTDDNRCLDHVQQWLDVYLIGNHEHPYFGGPKFSGFFYDAVINHRLKALDSAGIIHACVAVCDILVSHAGVTEYWTDDYGDARHFAADINDVWRESKNAAVFSDIGPQRGGYARHGGILWADFMERKSRAFPQVFGHTVGDEIRWTHDAREGERNTGWFSVCIDLGAKSPGSRLAGAWIRDGKVETVIFDPSHAGVTG